MSRYWESVVVNDDGSFNCGTWFIDYKPSDEYVTLEGQFSVGDLEKIIELMKNSNSIKNMKV